MSLHSGVDARSLRQRIGRGRGDWIRDRGRTRRWLGLRKRLWRGTEGVRRCGGKTGPVHLVMKARVGGARIVLESRLRILDAFALDRERVAALRGEKGPGAGRDLLGARWRNG
jgi:hypothetical protein